MTKRTKFTQSADSAAREMGYEGAREIREAVEKLMRIHYQHFMSRKSFWYEKNLMDADTLICIAASNLRMEIRNG